MSAFIDEYLRDFNPRHAAIRAGYSPRDAKQRAYRLLHHDHVAQELARRMQAARHGQTVIGADEAIVRLSDLARDPQVPVEQRIRILLFFLQRLEPRTSGSQAMPPSPADGLRDHAHRDVRSDPDPGRDDRPAVGSPPPPPPPPQPPPLAPKNPPVFSNHAAAPEPATMLTGKTRLRPADIDDSPAARTGAPRHMIRQWSRASLTTLPWIHPVFEFMAAIKMRRTCTHPRHLHRNHEIIAVEHGGYHCTVNQEALRLKAGDILILAPGDWHADAYRAGSRFHAFQFYFAPDAHGATPTMFAPGIPAHMKVVHHPPGHFAALFAQLDRESKLRDRFTGALQDALLLEFFWRLVRSLPPAALGAHFAQTSNDRSFLHDLERVMQACMRRHVTVTALAARMRMSVSALTHTCTRLLGIPPARMLLDSRLRLARQLLENPARSVKDVAAELGFADPYHFSKAYKRSFGTSPSAHRPDPTQAAGDPAETAPRSATISEAPWSKAENPVRDSG
jgi:AraC-like DNA-binding protein